MEEEAGSSRAGAKEVAPAGREVERGCSPTTRPKTRDSLSSMLRERKEQRRARLRAPLPASGSNSTAEGPRDEEAFALWTTLEGAKDKEVAEMAFYGVIPRWVGVHRLAGTPPRNERAFALTCNTRVELVSAAKRLLDLKDDVRDAELGLLLCIDGPLADVFATIWRKYMSALEQVESPEVEELAWHEAAVQRAREVAREGYGPMSDVLWALSCPEEELPGGEKDEPVEWFEGEGEEALPMRRADRSIRRRLEFAKGKVPGVEEWQDWEEFVAGMGASEWRLSEEDAEAMADWRRNGGEIPDWLEGWLKFSEGWAEWRKRKAAAEREKGKRAAGSPCDRAAALAVCRGGGGRGSPSRRPDKKPHDSSASQTHIHQLPDDCLVNIFRCLCNRSGSFPYCDNARVDKTLTMRHLLVCPLVCKRWRSLADAAVHALKFPSDKYVEQHLHGLDPRPVAVQALPRWSNLVHLDLSSYLECGYRDATLDAVSTICSLRKLAFCYFRDDLPAVCTRVGAIIQLATVELKCSEVPPVSDRHFSRVLRKLELENCEGHELPDSLGLFTGLVSLSVNSCSDLTLLPESLGSLSNLTQLHVTRCQQLCSLPDSLTRLRRLEELRVYRIEIWPDGFENLTALRELSTLECHLPRIFAEMKGLHHLSLCDDIAPPYLLCSLGGLSNLRTFEMMDAFSLKLCLPALGMLPGLKKLIIWEVEKLKALPGSLGHLTSLQRCELFALSSLCSLPDGICGWRALTSLRVLDCGALEEIPEGLGQLGALRELSISYCKRLASLPRSIGSLGRLEEMLVRSCPLITKLPDSVEDLGALRLLTVDRGMDLPEGLARRRGLGIKQV